MKKKLIKGLLVAVLVTGGILGTKKLYSQSETTGTWNPVFVQVGYWVNGQFIVTGYAVCCGAGTTFCSPSGC